MQADPAEPQSSTSQIPTGSPVDRFSWPPRPIVPDPNSAEDALEAEPSIPAGKPTTAGSPAARIAVGTVAEHLREVGAPELVRFVLFSEETYERFADALAELR